MKKTKESWNSQGQKGKGPLKVILSSVSAQAGPPKAAQDDVQMACEYLQGERLHNLPEQPVPKCSHFQSLLMFGKF